MSKQTTIKRITKHCTGNDSEDWLKYVTAVKQRDAARKEAERYDKCRRQEWRKYYAFDKVIKEMDEELGNNDVIEDLNEDEGIPDAPKKVKRKLEYD